MIVPDSPPAIGGGRLLRPIWNSERLDGLLAEMARLRPVASTGIAGLDALLGGGLMPGVTLLAGAPGTGKSSLALQLCDHCARFGRRGVVYASMEMSAGQLVAKSLVRLSAAMSEQPVSLREIPALLPHLADGANSRVSMLRDAVRVYAEEVAPRVATIDTLATVSDVSALYDDLPADELPPLMIVDYLQLCGREQGDEAATDVQHLAGVMRSLCALSKRHGVPVLALSSQNRTKRGTSALDSLAGTSELEYAAVCCLFLTVDGVGEDERQRNAEQPVRPVVLSASKNRFGPLGRLGLWFHAAQGRFIEREG